MWEYTKFILWFLGEEQKAGKGRDPGRWEDEKAWENGNQEDKRRQSHFNLLAGCYVCLSELCAQSL